jgi:hypothetical protein
MSVLDSILPENISRFIMFNNDYIFIYFNNIVGHNETVIFGMHNILKSKLCFRNQYISVLASCRTRFYIWSVFYLTIEILIKMTPVLHSWIVFVTTTTRYFE